MSRCGCCARAGNMSVADTLDVYVVRIGLQNAQFGYASAIGLIQGLGGSIPGGDDQYAEQEVYRSQPLVIERRRAMR